MTVTTVLTAWVVCYVVSIAADGTLATNGRSGIRVGPLLRSEEAWKEGHRAALRPCQVMAWAVTVISGLSAAAAFVWAELYLFLLGASVIVLLIGCGVAVWRAVLAAADTVGGRDHDR